jgi:hypothetical protein
MFLFDIAPLPMPAGRPLGCGMYFKILALSLGHPHGVLKNYLLFFSIAISPLRVGEYLFYTLLSLCATYGGRGQLSYDTKKLLH